MSAAPLRSGAALVEPAARGVVEVRGDDRVRWLDGMVSNAITGLEPNGPSSGCYALLLTPQGRIVADLHVLVRPERLLLELERASAAAVIERLERYVIADDVALADASSEFARLALEGPDAAAVLDAAVGRPVPLERDAVAEVALAGAPVLVAGYGLSAADGRQLLAPPAAADAVRAALLEAGARPASEEWLDVARVERGVPRLGRELDEGVLPAEARLERAVSETKGCYTGQEVVARMRSRDRVAHLLVGLRFADDLPAPGSELESEGRRVGEVTSAVRSEAFGAIGLGYVKRQLSEPGTSLRVGTGAAVEVVELPFESGAT